MDIDRFEALALAYGGDLRRWPEHEREAAEAFRARSPEAALRLLEEAGALDFVLDGWRPPAPSAALRERVIASAPRARRQGRGLGWWLSGAGFAAAAVAGVAAGFVVSSAAVSDLRADTLLSATLPAEVEAPVDGPFTIGVSEDRAA